MKPWENGGPYRPPEGWTFTQKRFGAHECGWVCIVPLFESARFQAEVKAHADTCPWPDPPELVETVSD